MRLNLAKSHCSRFKITRSPDEVGNLRLQQGQVTAAIDLYKDAIQADSFYTPPYLQLARVYSRLKDFKNPREILDLVLKVDPGNDAARQERQKLASCSEENLGCLPVSNGEGPG